MWKVVLSCAENNRAASNKIGTGDDDRVKAEVCANPGIGHVKVPGCGQGSSLYLGDHILERHVFSFPHPLETLDKYTENFVC